MPYFGDHENWGASAIESRARHLLRIAIRLWPRPEPTVLEPLPATEKGAAAAFHSDCIKIVQQHLGIHLSKLSQTRYESGDGRFRLICAVSAPHRESGEIPYFWFGLHAAQLDFLKTAEAPYICLGCSSAENTLLIPLSTLSGSLDLLSMTKTEDRQYWHVVVQKKSNRFVLRLLGGKDGPDLTAFNIGAVSQSAALVQGRPA